MVPPVFWPRPAGMDLTAQPNCDFIHSLTPERARESSILSKTETLEEEYSAENLCFEYQRRPPMGFTALPIDKNNTEESQLGCYFNVRYI